MRGFRARFARAVLRVLPAQLSRARAYGAYGIWDMQRVCVMLRFALRVLICKRKLIALFRGKEFALSRSSGATFARFARAVLRVLPVRLSRGGRAARAGIYDARSSLNVFILSAAK